MNDLQMMLILIGVGLIMLTLSFFIRESGELKLSAFVGGVVFLVLGLFGMGVIATWM